MTSECDTQSGCFWDRIGYSYTKLGCMLDIIMDTKYHWFLHCSETSENWSMRRTTCTSSSSARLMSIARRLTRTTCEISSTSTSKTRPRAIQTESSTVRRQICLISHLCKIAVTKTKQKVKNYTHVFPEKRFLEVINDMFLAGGETTSTALRWAFLFLIQNPRVQDKCRAEIKEVQWKAYD